MRKECPPGTRLMNEEERQHMLKELEQSKREVQTELDRMPISMKTLSLQKKKDELEEKLRGIEKNIDLFSRKKVFVAM